jgi:hypothetical protein
MKRLLVPILLAAALAGNAIGQTPTSTSASASQLAAEAAARIAADATKQPLDATLSALANQNFATNTVPIGTGVDQVSQITLDSGSVGAVLGNNGAGVASLPVSHGFFTKAASASFDPADLVLANIFTAAQKAPAWLLDTTNKELRAGSNTLASADNGKSIYLTSSGSTQTVPTGLPFGFRVTLYNTSAGDITLAIDAGVSINGSSSSITIAPKSKLELTPTVDGGGGVIAFRAVTAREPLAANTIWGRSSTGGASEKAVTDFAFSLLDDADAAAARTTLVLGNVNNTSDANKPVSTAQQTALDAKANLSGGNTISGAQTLTGQIELTGQAATTGASAMTRDLGDARFVRSARTTLPTADYTSASGANQCWIVEKWQIPGQTNGLSQTNGNGCIMATGRYSLNGTAAARQHSLQILPPILLAGGNISGSFRDGGSFFGDFEFNVNAGVVDLLANTISSRFKICGSGATSRKLRYKFSANFAANAGDVIVMSPSGHTFVVDDTVTDATVWTDATTGGCSVRVITGGGVPTTSDTSLTVNGGSPITTTFVANTASNTGTMPEATLFVSSAGVHLYNKTFGASGFFHLRADLNP